MSAQTWAINRFRLNFNTFTAGFLYHAVQFQIHLLNKVVLFQFNLFCVNGLAGLFVTNTMLSAGDIYRGSL